MEGEKQIEQSLEGDQSREENRDIQDEIGMEEKVIPMIEANQLHGDVTEERHENEAAEVKVDQNLQAMEERKVGEPHNGSLKKSKQGSKQNLETKVTIPQPFCLATETRMSRERRGSVDLKNYKPTLSRSCSLKYKTLSQSSIGAERTSDLRRAKSTSTTTKASLPPRITASQPVDRRVENGPKTKNRTQGKETEKKKPQENAKKQEEGKLENNKMRKSSSFKALPLPSFYQQKDPLCRPEIKKIPASHTKSPLVGQESKSVAKSGDGCKCKMALRAMSSGAKESISKHVKTT